MIESKKINIISLAAAAAVIAAALLMAGFAEGGYSYTPEYCEGVFGADIITVDIAADESDWQEMLDNAINEEYIMADVVINGRKYSKAGIRPKGNNSLQQVYSSDSDRYSFKIKFDEYIAGQTCMGLDMLVLNDMLGDASCMKEYTAFEMMKEMGIDAPCFGYAYITVNGSDWGLYFALEAYNDSYKQRVSGDGGGMLYNVKAAGMGQGGGMGGSGSGGTLEYTDDSPESYAAIFENAVGRSADEEEQSLVIAAVKALNSGTDIEKYFDVDEILRYLAVHTFTVNLDSYSSNMAQNYYIYEHNGVIKILPWDYNYAWGAFRSGSASDTVNFPIDTPVKGVQMSERPLISKLFENEEYFNRYHEYMRELVDKYFSGGKFAERLGSLDAVIGEYVKKDPTAFYTYDKYQTAAAAFAELGGLRAQSVLGQLNGTVPSTSEAQRTEADKLVSASEIKLSDLGGSGMGGEHGGGGMQDGDMQGRGMPGQNGGFRGGFREDGDFPEMPDGEPPDFSGGFIPDGTEDTAGESGSEAENDRQSDPPENDGDRFSERANNGGMHTPPDFRANGGGDTGEEKDGTAAVAVSLAVLAAALAAVSLVKGRF